jgi:hypothetical protein
MAILLAMAKPRKSQMDGRKRNGTHSSISTIPAILAGEPKSL